MSDRQHTHSPHRIENLIGRCLAGDAREAVADIEREELWEYVASHACLTEVGAALDHELRRQHIDIPTSIARQFDAYREHLVAANAYNLSRTEPILARLADAGLRFLLLKGVALTGTLFDQPGLRAMVDIDLLIHPDDAARADRLLKELGCRPGADLLNDDFYPHYYYEREYLTSDKPAVKIDLHVRPFRPLRYARTVPDDALWDNPTAITYGQTRLEIPSPENMLIHLAVHAACHGLGQLKWLYDIKLWLDRFGDTIDMAVLADKCRRWRLTWPMQRALDAVAERFGSPSTAMLLARQAVSQPVSLADRVVLAQTPRDVDHPAAALLVNMTATPGVRFRLGYLRSVLLPGPRHLGQLYHRRHPGWTVIAHAIRAGRSLARPFLPAPPEAA